MDAGAAYIIENGYPRKHFTGDKKKDYYITQAALWWYLDDTASGSNLSKKFKTTGSDKYGLRKYMVKLVNGAKQAKKAGYKKASISAKVSSTKMTLSSDKKYYVSNRIDANAKNINGKYTVSLSSAPSGSIITDVNGNKKTSFASNQKFLIKVPASKIAEGKTISVKAKVKATSKMYKAYKYQPTNKSMQPVALIAPVEKTLSNEIKVTATKPKKPTPAKPVIVVNKLDKATGNDIAGAKLVIKDSTGKVVKEFTSTTNGVKFDDLTIGGTYTLEEVSAPVGYNKTSDQVKFTVPNTTTVVNVKIYNEKKVKTVVINKLDKATGKAVSGAVLTVKDSAGNIVKEFTTTEQAYEISGLENGTYTVEEKQAPTGYKLSTEKKSFTISDDTTSASVDFYNEKEESTVVINKVDKKTGENIAGATLVVKDSNGNVIKRFVSTTAGYEITGLSNGTYTVEEEKAPAGYKLSTEKESFTISDDTKSVSVKFENELENAVVTISKIDSATGKLLPGAELLVTNSEGEEVARFTTTDSSYILKDLAYGTYTVEEVSAPEGYFLNEEKQTFTIDQDHLSAQVTIKNIPKTCENGGIDEDECSVDVPNTGSNQTLFTLLGIAITLMGVGYVYKKGKQQG